MDNKKEYKCSICMKSFMENFKLQNHMKETHDSIEKCIVCSLCGKGFPSKLVTKNHEKTHLNERNQKCHLCDKRFLTKGHLINHFNHLHSTTANNFKCEFCDMTSRSQRTLTNHIEEVHHKTKTHKCLKCEKSFTQKGSLNAHLRNSHEKAKDKKCEFCNKMFAKDLSRHIKYVHHKIKDHICNLCGEGFMESRILKRHKNKVHEGKKSIKTKTELTDTETKDDLKNTNRAMQSKIYLKHLQNDLKQSASKLKLEDFYEYIGS